MQQQYEFERYSLGDYLSTATETTVTSVDMVDMHLPSGRRFQAVLHKATATRDTAIQATTPSQMSTEPRYPGTTLRAYHRYWHY